MDPNYAPYVPVVVCTILVIGLAATILLLNRMLGPRRPTREKGIPYESGDDPVSRPKRPLGRQTRRAIKRPKLKTSRMTLDT